MGISLLIADVPWLGRLRLAGIGRCRPAARAAPAQRASFSIGAIVDDEKLVIDEAVPPPADRPGSSTAWRMLFRGRRLLAWLSSCRCVEGHRLLRPAAQLPSWPKSKVVISSPLPARSSTSGWRSARITSQY